MIYKATAAKKIQSHKTSCLVLGVGEDLKFGKYLSTVDSALGGHPAGLAKSMDISGKSGSKTVFFNESNNIKAERIIVLGLGAGENADLDKISAALSKIIKNAEYATISLAFDMDYDFIKRLIVAVEEDLYCFDAGKSKKKPVLKIKRVTIFAGSLNRATRVIAEAEAVAQGVNTARELGNLPSNICTPSYLAKKAKAMARTGSRLTVEVLSESDMKKLKMGALLAVAKGSNEPAKMIIFSYRGGEKTQKPVVLVGKGITFDSGGISLKPGANMDEMKFDMCGAASVFGVIRAVSEMKLPLNLVGIVPAAENLPSGKACKPGDIVTSKAGHTIEILNTDAEGRLILCDALTYAARFNPRAVIDIATLTGACVVALGRHASGLMANDDKLAKKIEQAGINSNDRVWRLPLWQEYDEQLKSNFADVANIGGREAGTITAGCFLARFTRDYKWAHLDIAGTAWKSGHNKGATGRPVKLLINYLLAAI